MAIIIDTQTINFEPTTSGTGTAGSKVVTLQTKDTYVPDDIQVTFTSTYNVRAGSFSNDPVDGTSYTDVTDSSTVINENGYLYINKGWFNDAKISLGQLIPDDVEYENAGNSHIRAGYEAYDPNGVKLIGTMPDVTPAFTGGIVSVTKPSVTISTEPKVTISSSGTFLPTGTGNTGANYGVTTTQPSGTDGTNYLTIDGIGTPSNGVAKTTATATRTAFNYSTSYAGYINVSSGSTPTGGAAPSSSTSKTSDNKSIVPTVTDNFNPLYIPIVNLANIGYGSGGLVQGTSSASATFTNPTVTLSQTGKFTELGSSGTGTTYGVTQTAPSGTDGVNFLKITTGGTSNSTAVSGTASISVTRNAVVPSSPQQGAINLTKTTTLLDSTTETFTTSISGNSISASVSGSTSYYIPIVSVSFSGGAVTAQSTYEVSSKPQVTYSASAAGKNSSGGSITIGNYGVTTTTNSSSNGYITFTASGSNTASGLVNAYADASRTAFTYTNSAGAIKAHSGTTASEAATATQVTSAIETQAEAVAGTTTKYRIPIVSLTNKGTGGGVTVRASISEDSITTTVPTVTVSKTGSMTATGNDAWGVTTTQPTSWTDGTSGVSITISSTKTNGSVTGNISGEYDRNAVTTSGDIKGAVSVLTGSPVTLLAAASGVSISNIGSFSSGDIVPTVSGASGTYYITKATTSISGGALTGDSTITCTSTGNFTCTPSVNFLSRSGSTTGSAITLSTYGITTTAPKSGSSVVFDPDGTLDAASRTVSASINVGRAAVTATISKGITKGATLTSNAVANTAFSGSKAVTASVAAGTNYYVPVVTIPKPTFGTATVTKPKVTMSSTASITGSLSTVPTGVVTQATVPSGWTDYITITPNDDSITNGSVAISSTVTVGKGLTAGGTKSENSTTNVSANTAISNKTFIKIYDESYTVTTIA